MGIQMNKKIYEDMIEQLDLAAVPDLTRNGYLDSNDQPIKVNNVCLLDAVGENWRMKDFLFSGGARNGREKYLNEPSWALDHRNEDQKAKDQAQYKQLRLNEERHFRYNPQDPF